MIDLRSDTVTRPTKAMLEAMVNAEVGDDVFGEDPTINALEEKASKMFGKEAALYCPSGTMTNQLAVKNHTQPGDEVIIERTNHVYFYEAGGIAFHSGCSVRLIHGDRGRIKPQDILDNINPINDHHTNTRLVSIENTANRGGGSYYTLPEMIALGKTAHDNGLKIHLDGARIFNALAELNIAPAELGPQFDSISVCLSKGLGCPVGSLLLSNKEFIKGTRKYRKIFGGGMRQAGLLAAAGIYALDHHVGRLKDDHRKAKAIGAFLETAYYTDWMLPVETNIIIFKLKDEFSAEKFTALLKESEILCIPIGKNQVRMVTHLDVDDSMVEKAISILSRVNL
ncbi:MAG: aminotransferase class V-fold PLP-dependent enzyme [Chitinophagales bacterium]|nr:aminotransferase class V-fold PLP-dependent enzyme [Chitinophagales bacterium]